MRFVLAIVLLSIGLAQDKPAVPSVPFKDIIACVQAANCKNMTPARVSVWADVGPPMGMVFHDNGWKYELSLSGRVGQPRDLSIMTTAPGETRPGQLITIDADGKVVDAALARLPGEPAAAGRRAPGEIEAEWKRRKSFVAEPRWSRGGTLGEEFREFWEKQADQALAAIARALNRAPEPQDKPAAAAASFEKAFACVRAGACKNMTAARIHWFDVINIVVLTFSDDGWTYGLLVAPQRDKPERLTVFLTPPGEGRPTQQLGLIANGQLVTASLGPLMFEGLFDGRDHAAWLLSHQVYAAAGWHPSGQLVGEQFKPFWQKQADQAIAAIARVMAR
jgi:hypothetical protein